jgi:hypothetical protein
VLLFSTDTGQFLVMVNDGMMQRARVGATSGVALNISRKTLRCLTRHRFRRAVSSSDLRAALRGDKGLQPTEKPPAFRRALSKGLDLDARRGSPEQAPTADVLVTATTR